MKNLSYQYQKENETGRTMVEMFSVVVLISLLTLVGLGAIGISRQFLSSNHVSRVLLSEGALFLSERKYFQQGKTEQGKRSLENKIAENLKGAQNSEISVAIKKLERTKYSIKLSGLEKSTCERTAKILDGQSVDYSDDCSNGNLTVTFEK